MAMRIGRNPGASTQKLRSLAAAVDPTLLIDEVRPLDDIGRSEVRSNRLFGAAVAFAIYFVVLLSAAVTFALMSFTVSQRTREIGIRKALGAGPRAVLSSVLARAFVQLALGAGLGAAASIAAFSRVPDTYIATPGTIAVVVAFLVATGLLSCGAPALRALRVEPTEAIRDE
jgi:ABC-type antimicrobial peptide transport system permease subunit